MSDAASRLRAEIDHRSPSGGQRTAARPGVERIDQALLAASHRHPLPMVAATSTMERPIADPGDLDTLAENGVLPVEFAEALKASVWGELSDPDWSELHAALKSYARREPPVHPSDQDEDLQAIVEEMLSQAEAVRTFRDDQNTAKRERMLERQQRMLGRGARRPRQRWHGPRS